MKIRVAYQGSRGAYSEMALYQFFGDKVEAIGLELSEQVCEAVRDGEVTHAILPVENSIVGNVDVNVDLLYQHDVYAIGEQYLKINHQLLARPGVKLKDIKTVYSHPIALAQCRDFINRHKIQAHAAFDTAGACQMLNDKGSRDEATIASVLCSTYYGLEVIEDHIQKVRNNITRFLVFVRSDRIPADLRPTKTSMAFTAHHRPGALLSCLQEFAFHGINLTKLESRPIPENPFDYTFFVDFLGHQKEERVEKCLNGLRSHAGSLKIIGSYPEGKRPANE